MTGSADGSRKIVGNPFVGPRPFEAGERIWGRDREIRQLDDLLSAERIVLLHSPSGAGKSSLVQAGLIPRLKRSFDIWGPTRFHQEVPQSLAGGQVNRYVLSALQGFEEGVPERLRRSSEVLAHQTLRQYVDARPRRRSAPQSMLLIFDQFEEVLTTDPMAIDAKRQLFDQLGDLLRDPNVWALFALREDYLAPLDPYAQQVPTHLKVRFRIDLLGLEGALQAMVQPAKEGGRDFPAAEQLVGDLATMKVQQPDGTFVQQTGHHVEPVQLQVVCRRLWQAMPDEDRSIDAEDLEQFGDVSEALAGYYADSVRRIAADEPTREWTIRRWFDDHLITAATTRGQVLRGAEHSEGLANALIEELLDTHLVRAEQRAGSTWYELAHDRLIEPLLVDNLSWSEQHLSTVQRRASLWQRQGRPAGLLVADEDLVAAERWVRDDATVLTEAEGEFLDASRQAQKVVDRERRQASRIRWLAIAASIVGVLAVVAGLVAGFKWRESAEQALKASNLAKSAFANNLLSVGRALEGNLLGLEISDPTGTPTAVSTLQKNLSVPVEMGVFEQHDSWVKSVVWSPEGRRIVSTSGDETARVWWAESAIEILELEGHQATVASAQWSPDGSRIVTASVDRTVRVWDAESGQNLAVLEGHGDAVSQATWSPDGSRIASISLDGVARLWNAQTSELEVELSGHSQGGHTVAWHPEGSRLVTASSDATAYLWDAVTGERLAILKGHESAVGMALWSPDGTKIATVSSDATARIWDGTDGRALKVLSGHQRGIRNASWSPDGERLATASSDKTVRVWEVDSGFSSATLDGHSNFVRGVTWSPDGTRLVTSSYDNSGRLWQSTGGETLGILRGHTQPVTGAVWSPKAPRLVTASMDNSARVWNMEVGEEIAHLGEHQLDVGTAAFSPKGDRVLTTSRDSARIWDVSLAQPMVHFEDFRTSFYSAAWSPDGKHVVSANGDFTARLWDAEKGVSTAVLWGHSGRIEGVAFAPDNQRVVTASRDQTARIWDITGQELAILRGHRGDLTAAAWSPDGTRIATTSRDATARLWDAATGKELATLLGHSARVSSPVWSPDGHRLVTVSKDNSARLWDAATGESVAVLRGHGDTVMMASWSPDGHRMVTASLDGTARLWNSSGQFLLSLSGHEEAVTSASWSFDGTRVLTTSTDRTARLWDVGSGANLAILRGHREAVMIGSFSPDDSMIITASRDKTVRVWANATEQAIYLQARSRARTRRCLDAEFRQTYLGESSAEANRGVEGCETCVPEFFERLGDASLLQWQEYIEAWQTYQQCLGRD